MSICISSICHAWLATGYCHTLMTLSEIAIEIRTRCFTRSLCKSQKRSLQVLSRTAQWSENEGPLSSSSMNRRSDDNQANPCVGDQEAAEQSENLDSASTSRQLYISIVS